MKSRPNRFRRDFSLPARNYMNRCHVEAVSLAAKENAAGKTGSHCGGNFVYLDSGVKDCSNCLVPHGRGSYSYVLKKYPELMELAKKNR